MAGTTLIPTVKYVAGTKPSFFLSEILPYLDEPLSVEEIFRILSPELPRLGLVARRAGGDVEISRITAAPPYLLNTGERERTDTFLARREIPAALAGAVEQYITRKVGRAWDDPVILDRLRKAIVAQKGDYWKAPHKRTVRYTSGYSVFGYLAYHFPVYFLQTEHLLARLARDGLLKNPMTILDIGTGPGVVPLAIADFWSRLDGARAAVYSIERSEEHIEAFLALREAFVPPGGPVSIKPPIRSDIREPFPPSVPAKADLIIFSNVLNELAGPDGDPREGIVERAAERLAPGGAILIVEPADEENATGMRILAASLAGKGLHVYAPCPFIRGTPCTASRCWSFETAPAIRPTRVMESLARCEESYRYMNTDIKFSWTLLRPAGTPREGYRVSPHAKFIRLSKIHLHDGKRVNAVVAKMSGELGDAKYHLFKVCDGTAKVPVFAVLPAFHRTPANEALRSAPYGTVLELHGVLVRYNRAHDAYNLLVSRNTVVTIPCEPGREE